MSNSVNRVTNPMKVITGPDTRWSYANVWEPKSINGGAAKYSVSLIIPKSDTKTVAKIKAAIEAAYQEGQAKLKGNGRSVPPLAAIKNPLRDGDVERPDDPAYANAYFVNANSATAPGIVDADRNPVLPCSEVYSGVYGRASINFYAFNSNGNKGIACGLNNLQLIRAGEPLGGKASAESDFATDALDGKIDLIVTKSVSRFARNTVDSLVTIRKLKENGVECYFEKEGIYTFDGKGELLITIMSSLAQEESRSISENITWGQRKSFSDGKVHLPYKRFLGYEKGEDGRPAVVESKARVVKLIYGLFLEGKTQAGICKYLEKLGIPSPGGKQTWSKTTITSILQNEKYKGDALLQKKFTVDFLEKKMKPNEGEIPQYYVTGSHPAIIEPDEWEQVQAEFARRKTLGKAYSGKSILSAKLVCEDCGAFFGPKVWHSTDQYRRTIWQCNGKFANEERCHTPVMDTETIQRLFIKAYNLMMQDRVQIIKQCEAWRARLMDFGTLDADIERQLEETQVVAELVKAAVKENASTAQSQEAYLKKYEALTERYEKAAAELERLQSLRTARSQQDKKMALYIRTLKKQPEVMHDWNDTIWTVMIEKAIVHKDGQITFFPERHGNQGRSVTAPAFFAEK